jgi:hypothetical protein
MDLMDLLQKYVYGVFELPLPRNAQKRTKKTSQGKKKSDGGWVGLGFSKCTGGSVDFFCRPLGCFYVGLRLFGLFCKNLLHVILTPPARYQHPHDTNSPPVVGHWGNCEPKWWPQGRRQHLLLLKNKTANTQEVNSTGW